MLIPRHRCALGLLAALVGCEPTPFAAHSGDAAGVGAAGGAYGAGGTASQASGGTGGVSTPVGPRMLDVDMIFKNGCATVSPASMLLRSNLLFVIDRSASMACNPPPTTDSAACESKSIQVDLTLPSKWQITRQSLLRAMDVLPDDVVVGLSYFSKDDSCGVASAPDVPLAPLGPVQRAAIAKSLDGVVPGGATPLVGATILAYQHLHNAAVHGAIGGNQFVVLITDGQQSDVCSDPMLCTDQASCTSLLVDQEVPKASGPGVAIRTFVIGVPGSEPARAVLSRIAKNGRTAPAGCNVDAGGCHFDMTAQPNFAAALGQALDTIAGQVLNCELPLPRASETKVDLDRVNVVYSPPDGSAPLIIAKDDRAGCDDGADGWQYADGETKIRLCGPKCTLVRKHPGARVDVVLGCPVIVPG